MLHTCAAPPGRPHAVFWKQVLSEHSVKFCDDVASATGIIFWVSLILVSVYSLSLNNEIFNDI